MKLRHLLSSIILVTAIAATPQVLANSWYGGLFMSYNQLHTGYNYTFTELTSPAFFNVVEFRDYVIDLGYGGGVVAGYWAPCRGRYKYGFSIDALANSTPGGSHAADNDSIGPQTTPQPSSVITNVALRYQVNLTFNLLMHATKRLSTYFKIGASMIDIRYRFSNLDTFFIHSPDSNVIESSHYQYYGWTFGLGLQLKIKKKYTAFAEFNRSSFGSHGLPNVDITAPGGIAGGVSTGVYTRRLEDIVNNTVKFGVVYTFKTT